MNFEKKFPNFKSNHSELRDPAVGNEKNNLDLPSPEEIAAAPSFKSRDAFESWIGQKKKTPQGYRELDNFYSLVERATGGESAGVFAYLKELEEKNKNLSEGEKIEPVCDPFERLNNLDPAKYGEGQVISSLDIEDFSDILKSLNPETRQFVFANRDHLTLSKVKEIIRYRLIDSTIVYHVSPNNIDLGDSLKGDVYFSTDIKQLFKAPGAQYLYAFRLPKQQIETTKYGAKDCFGYLKNSGSGVGIIDKIEIYDDKQPKKAGNQKEILDSLGAAFADYLPASQRGNRFSDTYRDNYELKY